MQHAWAMPPCTALLGLYWHIACRVVFAAFALYLNRKWEQKRVVVSCNMVLNHMWFLGPHIMYDKRFLSSRMGVGCVCGVVWSFESASLAIIAFSTPSDCIDTNPRRGATVQSANKEEWAHRESPRRSITPKWMHGWYRKVG